MGLKIFFENLRHAVKQPSLAETLRHNAAIAEINLARTVDIGIENTNHRASVSDEKVKHLIADKSLSEDIRHEFSVLVEDVVYEVWLLAIDLAH